MVVNPLDKLYDFVDFLCSYSSFAILLYLDQTHIFSSAVTTKEGVEESCSERSGILFVHGEQAPKFA